MSVSEELLMAYADGELEGVEHASERAQVEAAMQADPTVANRVARHKALRRRVSAAFDPVLSEPVPQRLIVTVRSKPSARHVATVTDIGRARAAKAAETAATQEPAPRSMWTWNQWGAVAASLLVGVALGYFALQSRDGGALSTRGGRLVAQGALDEALSNQLAANQVSDAPVRINVTFKAKSGAYCRTFVMEEEQPLGGLACQENGAWHVRTLVSIERPADFPGTAPGGYRLAGAEVPAAVQTAVIEQIVGEPFDADAEARARASGWK